MRYHAIATIFSIALRYFCTHSRRDETTEICSETKPRSMHCCGQRLSSEWPIGHFDVGICRQRSYYVQVRFHTSCISIVANFIDSDPKRLIDARRITEDIRQASSQDYMQLRLQLWHAWLSTSAMVDRIPPGTNASAPNPPVPNPPTAVPPTPNHPAPQPLSQPRNFNLPPRPDSRVAAALSEEERIMEWGRRYDAERQRKISSGILTEEDYDASHYLRCPYPTCRSLRSGFSRNDIDDHL